MKQTELIELIAKSNNMRQDAVRKVLRQLTKYMCVALENGEPLRFGMGIFEMKEMKARPVQNFSTGERYLTGPANKIVFSPSAYVKTTIKKANAKSQANFTPVILGKTKSKYDNVNSDVKSNTDENVNG